MSSVPRQTPVKALPSAALLFLLASPPARGHEVLDFARDVQPIIERSCGGSGCHLGERTSGVEMTTYEALMASVGDQYGRPVVVPGDPDGSPLIDKVANVAPAFGLREPNGGEPLGAGDIAILRRWIAEGATRSHLPLRGDADANDTRDVTDAIRILDHLFRGGGPLYCPAQGDANGDATIDLSDAIYLLLFLFVGGSDPGTISEAEAEACQAQHELSFANIHEMIFQRGCSYSSCHSAASRKGGLVLDTLGAAYDALVGVQPANEVARTAGYLRVDPGRPETSFLLRKLAQPGPGEGNRMPSNTNRPLSEATVALIREWVLAGAPREGTISGVPRITEEPPAPVNRLQQPPVPENGIQLHLPAFPVARRGERQLHYFIGKPFASLPQAQIEVQRIDVHMMEQSHHFVLFNWIAPQDPRAGYREGTNIDVDQERVVVVTQQSFFSLAFPPGVGLKFPKDARFDLNSHYINLDGDDTLWGEVYVNIFFAEPGTVATEIKPMFDLGGEIHVPPYQTTTAQGIFPSGSSITADPGLGSGGRLARATHIYALTSHTHRHGIRFEGFLAQNGVSTVERLYDNHSWDDPEFTVFNPPRVLQPGQGIYYRATYHYHDPPSPTSPPLAWGITSEEEMIILMGYYAVP
jgi:hypothetical protein